MSMSRGTVLFTRALQGPMRHYTEKLIHALRNMRFRVSQLESAASPRATLVRRRLSPHGSALTTRRLFRPPSVRILLLQLSRKQNPTSGTPASSCPTARARGPEPRPARRPLFAEELSALACTWVLAPAVGACSRNYVVSLGSVRLWASTSVGDPADLTRFRVSRAVQPRSNLTNSTGQQSR